MKKFLSVLCLLGLLAAPLVACAPENDEPDAVDVDVNDSTMTTSMDEGMDEMEPMDTMDTGMMDTGMDTGMDDGMAPPAE